MIDYNLLVHIDIIIIIDSEEFKYNYFKTFMILFILFREVVNYLVNSLKNFHNYTYLVKVLKHLIKLVWLYLSLINDIKLFPSNIGKVNKGWVIIFNNSILRDYDHYDF